MMNRMYASKITDEDHLVWFIHKEPNEWISIEFMIQEEAIPGTQDRARYELALQRLVDSNRVRTKTVTAPVKHTDCDCWLCVSFR